MNVGAFRETRIPVAPLLSTEDVVGSSLETKTLTDFVQYDELIISFIKF